MSPLDYIDDEPEAYYTPEGRLRLTIRPGKEVAQSEEQGGSGPLTNVRNLVTAPLELGPPMRDLSQRFDAARNALAERGLLDKLLGINGPRFQTWPERMVRSAVTAPGETYQTGQLTTHDPYGNVTGQQPVRDPETGRTSMPVIERVQDLAGMVTGGSMPAAAKGALGTAGGRMVQPEVPKVDGPFYSAVEHAIVNAPQAKMTPQQWVGWLKNQPGVKAEELGWLGLDDPLALSVEWKGPVTKETLLEHAQGHGPKIKEVEKKGRVLDEESIGDRALEIMNEEYPQLKEGTDEWYNAFDDATMRADSELRGGEQGEFGPGAPKFSDYQLPGGENYRELLLTMPYEKKGLQIHEGETAVDALNRMQAEHPAPYKSSHWDEPNVLVHMRMNDRYIPDATGPRFVTEDGGMLKSLHLEEVQSDWHQEGRKKGYKQPISEKNRPAAIEKLHDLERQLDNMYSKRDTAEYIALKVEIDILRNKITGNNGVPDAPFKSTWADLALKRAISKAAREGYDAISWTPGEQQAARYDLSKQLEKVKIKSNKDGTYDVIGWRPGSARAGANGEGIAKSVPVDKLQDIVGKDLAEKIVADQIKPGAPKEYSGLDLKVGGEGMKAFYDKMLVDKANTIVKKFGGKVEWKELPDQSYNYEIVPYSHTGQDKFTVIGERAGPEGESQSMSLGLFDTRQAAEEALAARQKANPPIRVPVLRLTPKMKEAATGKGFPLFSSGLPFQFVPVDHDPFDDRLRSGDAT